jgi:hypothetical protein
LSDTLTKQAEPVGRPNEKLDAFREVWVVDFAYDRPLGECPRPTALMAKEHRTGRRLQLHAGELHSLPPYPLCPDALFVTYDAPAQLGCHLALGWPLPSRVLDLHAEFRCLTSGLDVPNHDLPGALACFNLTEGPDPLQRLLDAMLPRLDVPRALLRGRYTAAMARMERTGVPIDMETLTRLRDNWEAVRGRLIEGVDRGYGGGFFRDGKLKGRRWAAWAASRGISWPRDGEDEPLVDLDTLRGMAKLHPEVRPMARLWSTLQALLPVSDGRLAVGPDGRNRTPLRPFASKTGRNQPSTAEFAFGLAGWLRGLIRPADGTALAYVDYAQQEFGIAAALCGDAKMQEAYRCGDPYLAFAKQAGAVPADATKHSHRDERELFKQCVLGVSYSMGAMTLAERLGDGKRLGRAQRLLALHRRTYPTYWAWSAAVGKLASKQGRLTTVLGWTLNAPKGSRWRSVRNFPLQANGAEMLRLACCALTETGVRVCAPVHDALLIEAPVGEIDRAAAACREAMRKASEVVLPGFPLRTDCMVARPPERFPLSPTQAAAWERLLGVLHA